MSSATNALEEAIGDHLLRTATWSKPSAIWVALFTTLPGEDGSGGVEVSGGSYTRVQCGPGNAYWTGPTDGNGIYSNTSVIQFPAPTANWGTIVGFGLMSASTSGTCYIAKLFTNSSVINSGDQAPGFDANTLTITLA